MSTEPESSNPTDANAPNDPLFDAMALSWEHIVAAYRQSKAERPIVIYETQDKTVSALPYEKFKTDLPLTSQALLASQCERAERLGQMVVCVQNRDAATSAFYLLDYE